MSQREREPCQPTLGRGRCKDPQGAPHQRIVAGDAVGDRRGEHVSRQLCRVAVAWDEQVDELDDAGRVAAAEDAPGPSVAASRPAQQHGVVGVLRST